MQIVVQPEQVRVRNSTLTTEAATLELPPNRRWLRGRQDALLVGLDGKPSLRVGEPAWRPQPPPTGQEEVLLGVVYVSARVPARVSRVAFRLGLQRPGFSFRHRWYAMREQIDDAWYNLRERFGG